MNRDELQQKWPQSQFEAWQQEGTFSRTMTYENYLQFRAEQQQETERQIRVLTERYGEPPNEQAPEMSLADEQDLRAAWNETAAARAQNKIAPHPERIAA